MEKRIIQLETLSALQDNAITELNTELFRQQKDTNALKQRIERLEKKILELHQPDEIAENERPPHY